MPAKPCCDLLSLYTWKQTLSSLLFFGCIHTETVLPHSWHTFFINALGIWKYFNNIIFNILCKFWLVDHRKSLHSVCFAELNLLYPTLKYRSVHLVPDRKQAPDRSGEKLKCSDTQTLTGEGTGRVQDSLSTHTLKAHSMVTYKWLCVPTLHTCAVLFSNSHTQTHRRLYAAGKLHLLIYIPELHATH